MYLAAGVVLCHIRPADLSTPSISSLACRSNINKCSGFVVERLLDGSQPKQCRTRGNVGLEEQGHKDALARGYMIFVTSSST